MRGACPLMNEPTLAKTVLSHRPCGTAKIFSASDQLRPELRLWLVPSQFERNSNARRMVHIEAVDYLLVRK